MPSHSMFTASFNVFYLSLLYFLKSSCNKIVNKYAQPLHVYRLLSAVLFFILCFLFLFVLFSCSVCIIPRLCDSFNR